MANFLKSRKGIVAFVVFSPTTVIKHNKVYPGMPIRQEGGIWIGDPEKLEAFYKDRAAGETEKWR